MGSKPTIVIGARAGTLAAADMAHVSVFVGRVITDYASSCQSGCFPEGTLSRIGDEWFEVQPHPKWYYLYPMRVDPPSAGEIITRERER